MTAMFTATSLRADRNAALLSEPPWCRTPTSSQALVPLIAIAPSEASTTGPTSGATGSEKRSTTCHAASAAGPRMTRAIAFPTMARRARGHPSATKISRLMAVSSRKSTLSARSETEPAKSATVNSTKK